MKNKMSKSKVTNRVTGLQEFLDSLSKPEMKKGGMSKMANEGFNNAKRTITDGYKGTGAPNPLRNIVKKNKMQMGGPFFSMNPSTPMIGAGKNFENKGSFKKGGMVKKKKKNC